MDMREEMTYLHEEKQSSNSMIPVTWGARQQVELNGLRHQPVSPSAEASILDLLLSFCFLLYMADLHFRQI